MSLGPYTSFIVTSYLAAATVVALLIGWIALDYRSLRRRLREIEEAHPDWIVSWSPSHRVGHAPVSSFAGRKT